MASQVFFRRFVLVVWLVSLIGAIVLSLKPGVELPVQFWNADKVYHCLAYAWLGGLPLLAFVRPDRARAAAYCMIPMGALLEWGQSFVPGRTADMGDAVANALGVFIGIWLIETLWLRGQKRSE
jgi:VanZ family protein